MRRGPLGTYEPSVAGGEVCEAFVPSPLPPRPSLVLDTGLQERLYGAHLALGRLDGLSLLTPEASVLLHHFARKEAVMSSRIEGTRSSLADLLLYEADGVPATPVDDVRQVSSGVQALEHGLAQMRQGVPMGTRLMNDMHRRLMTHGHGATMAPGELRRAQNWIGAGSPAAAPFVPPPPHRLDRCLSDLERFIHDQPARHPALIKAAMAHLQFETIHPYLDGNGRLGRLLIPLMLVSEGVLREPLLYASLYLDAHRSAYFRLLQGVREHGDWESWLSFFAAAVEVAALHAVNTTLAVKGLIDADSARIVMLAEDDALRVHHLLSGDPVARVEDMVACLRGDRPALERGIAVLEEMAIVRTVCGTAGQRILVYTAYLDLLNNEET